MSAVKKISSLDDYKPYTAIGPRLVPVEVQEEMIKLGRELSDLGFTLRSGGDLGSDRAFEAGVELSNIPNKKAIYLPMRNFGGSTSPNFMWPDSYKEKQAMNLVSQNHPDWKNCFPILKKIHTRNVARLLGYTLNQPSSFLIYWVDKKEFTGEIGLTLKLAVQFEIPHFFLGSPTEVAELKDLLPSLL